jgi:hypothetical protein
MKEMKKMKNDVFSDYRIIIEDTNISSIITVYGRGIVAIFYPRM